jgi:hypothetical protein
MNSGKYKDAAESLRHYLAHAENPEDSLEVKAKIDILLSAEKKK